MIKILSTIAVLSLLAACAASPDSIAPVSMGNAYDATSCQQTAIMLANERQTLANLEGKQKGAVVGDAVGVFLIGVPVSSLTGGDVSGHIAASKGKILALEARMTGCAK